MVYSTGTATADKNSFFSLNYSKKRYYLTKKHARTVGKLDPYKIEMVANDRSHDESCQAIRS